MATHVEKHQNHADGDCLVEFLPREEHTESTLSTLRELSTLRAHSFVNFGNPASYIEAQFQTPCTQKQRLYTL